MKWILCISLLFSFAHAEEVYQSQDDFLASTFDSVPDPQRLTLSGDLSKQVKKILDHRYKKIRVPYWQDGCRTAWVLEEIGKERPITTGFAVNSQGLEKVKVLVFRESRGWEVKHDFFGQQFIGAKLTDKNRLDTTIDNISGATLSVNAVTSISRMALLLHEHVTKDSC
ncbi:MAG: FMN-binding protein [Gammaproteobacteria bacterium]|nr:FMN-binding protein [Gammaproteobacteria bacterium]NNC68996.1 FMN-binding protein [Gammaproteobacteria bacterium]